ncbi:MAG: transglycosylase SLT domain-containing protein [Dehalococcoidia bacterium]|nr:transglycosylase SLT domain-containing protein [Dehalococcoidia bacterium]
MLLATLFLVLIGACGIGAGSRPPTSTPRATDEVPGPSPDVPLDLDLADKLLHDGDAEQALAIYDAVAGSSKKGGAEWRRAIQSAARVHYREDRIDDVESSLTALLDENPPAEERQQALLLLGAARQEAGHTDTAREALAKYIEAGGDAAAQVRLRLAAALTADGEDVAAIKQLQLALADDLPPPQETSALFALAHGLEASDRGTEALAAWQRAADEGATASQRGDALSLLATLALRLGDDQRYQDALVTLVRDYPWHNRALDALGQGRLALDTIDRAVVLFTRGENDFASAAFHAVLDQDQSALGQARARYYLALLAERDGSNDEALAQYDAALAGLAGLEGQQVYGEAAWERALLLETLGRTDEAVAAYAALAVASPRSQRAAEALFRAGLLRFRAGRPGDAAVHWNRYLALASGDEATRARFWLAKTALATGDTTTADAHLRAAAAAAPWGYYGLRAAALLAGAPPLTLTEGAPDVPVADWPAVEAWLTTWAGPEDVAARRALTEGLPWRRGLELLHAGLRQEAEAQFADLINDVAGRPWLLYRLARALDGEGQTSAAARAAARLIGERPNAPRELLRLAYPDEYLDLATDAAKANGFPPLLLLALVRQESFFDPEAESSAGALGLTQVIPSTADEIAGQIDEPDFTYADLFRPTVSLRFGSHYLGSQLNLFESDIPAALAAYNGGPGNSLRWSESAGADPDVFLEVIGLSETRAYVELVVEHYARYRYAYGFADGPTLPLR